MTARRAARGSLLHVALLLHLMGSTVAAQPASPAARVVSIQGRVEVERSGRVQPATARQELMVGDIVRTGPDGRAAILLADESQVKVNTNSTLRIRAVAARPARGVIPAAARAARTLLDLVVGEAWFASPGRPDSLEIDTPVATATIRGTEFDLSVAADGESRVAVVEGQVDYRTPHGGVLVLRGELGIARRGEAPLKQTLLTPEDAVQWMLYYPGILSVRDHPLVSGDASRLPSLLARAQAEAESAPADLDRQAHVAELLHDLGRGREAWSLASALLARRPEFPRVLNTLGWIALGEGRTGEAVARFDAVRPPTASSLLGVSLARFRAGALEASAAAVQEALGRFGPSPTLLTHAALLELLKGNVTAARRAIDGALRLDPAFAPAYGLRSNIALVQNRKGDAKGAALLAVRANPDSPSARLNLSLALQAHFELEAALSEARKAVALDPRHAQAHVQVARLLFGEGRIDQALESVERAQALAPREPLALSTLGFILLARGETDGAVSAFGQALASASSTADAYVGLGLAAFRQGLVEDGLRHFQAAVLLEPRVSLYHSYLAKALYQVGRRDEALAALDRARALDPRDPTPELYRATFLRDLNRPVESILAFQRSVALNDHRAVYRSRLLLDRDLAARNVNLALAYMALGQAERALAAGVRAAHEDPQSSSAHLFYGSLIGLTLGAYQPGLSELLQTRLLLPVNQNTFNTFNDYTMLLEQPRLQGSLEGGGGSLGTGLASLSVTGGTSRIAGEQFLTYSTTDGPKRWNSDEESWSSATFLKWAPPLRSSAFVHVFHQEQAGGDIFVDQRHFTANDPDLRQNAQATFLGLGYQLQTRPENNLLLYAQGQLERIRIRDREVVVAPFPLVPGSTLRTSQDQNVLVHEPFYDLQAAYLHRLGTHQLWFAADYFNGEPATRVGTLTVADVLLGGVPLASVSLDSSRRQRFHQQFVTLVAHDTWHVLPTLSLTGALRYDHARAGHLFSELRHNSSVLSPQGGLLWRATPAHTLRLAAFQAFQTQPHAVLSPSHIAGFFIDAPITTSSISRQYHAAWDADLFPRTFLTLGAFRREIDSPVYASRPDGARERNTIERRRTGLTAAVNQLVGDHVGLSLGYTRVHREGAGEHDGADDLVRAGLSLVHPSGFSASASLTYVKQELGSTRAAGAPADVWVASLSPAYEFPDKRGALSVQIENVLRQRFEFVSTRGVRNDLVLGERPDLRLLATLRLNF